MSFLKNLYSMFWKPSQVPVREAVVAGRARLVITHMRPSRFLAHNGRTIPDPTSYEPVAEPEEVYNLITKAGRDFLHAQGYATSGIAANGLNYIGLSNDAVSETADSTTLSNEITTNGFARAQGAVAHTANTAITTISKTFTATGAQSIQKAALFTAASGGVMNHVLGFTPRSLLIGDTLTLTFSISLGA